MSLMPFRLMALAFVSYVLSHAISGAARAGESDGDRVLAENATVKVYRSEYDAELLKLPADIRPGFANSPSRVGELLDRMLVQKTLAARAREAKLDGVRQNATRLRLEADRTLAQIYIADIEEQAGREFDAKLAQYEARAREIYVVDRKKYEIPERIAASHILFSLEKHSKDEAQKLALEARAKVLAGANFNQLAKEISEDPSAARNGGKLELFQRAEMDPAFADAAFALKKKGDVSAPVLSSFGWHIIRLDDRQPGRVRSFDEVRATMLADLRKKQVEEKREALLSSVRHDPTLKVNMEAVDSLIVLPDADTNKAIEGRSGAQAPARSK
jgi:parvulin-like peptidyl-prolyl isomerase